MQNFNPAAIHSADIIPPLLRLNHPPAIAPISNITAPETRRFRFGFAGSAAPRVGSDPISKYTLVNTTAGISA